MLPGRDIQGSSPREERITVTETVSSGKSSYERVCGLECSTHQRAAEGSNPHMSVSILRKTSGLLGVIQSN